MKLKHFLLSLLFVFWASTSMVQASAETTAPPAPVEEVEKELKIPVKIVEEDGASLVSAVLEKDAGRAHRRRQMYEQTDCSDCRET